MGFSTMPQSFFGVILLSLVRGAGLRVWGEAALDGKDFGVCLGALCREKLGSACSQPLLDAFGSLGAKPVPVRAVQPPGMER